MGARVATVVMLMLAIGAGAAPTNKGTLRLRILHTNDMHSR